MPPSCTRFFLASLLLPIFACSSSSDPSDGAPATPAGTTTAPNGSPSSPPTSTAPADAGTPPPEPPPAGSKSGDLDTTWGVAGSRDLPLATASSALGDLVLTPDGKVLASGSIAYDAWQGPAFVARLDASGAVDTAFGTAGVAQPKAVADGKNYGGAMRMQTSGVRIFTAVSYLGLGNVAGPVRVLALNASDGSLDTTFATNGATEGTVSPNHDEWEAQSLDVLPNGNIVVGGYGFISLGFLDAVMIRYLPTGAVDTTFTKMIYPGTDRETRGPIGVSYLKAAIPLAAGQVLAVGNRQSPTTSTAFDQMIGVKSDASVVMTFPSAGSLEDAAKAADGSVYAVGKNATDAIVMHLTSAGAIDTTFGTNGSRAITTPCNAERVVPAPGGKLLIAGRCIVGTALTNATLIRLGADGAIDKTFGTAGTVALPLQTVARLAVQPDGKILAYGHTAKATTVVRLLP